MGQILNKPKPGEASQQNGKLSEELEPIIEQIYIEDLENKKVEYDDLYHAIFKMIQELRKKKGAMRYNLPSKERLKIAFDKHHTRKRSTLTKKECSDIINEVFTFDDISVGKGADMLLYLFGAPICALFAKRMIPGMRSISDDVVIPLATSGSVIFLAKTHKL